MYLPIEIKPKNVFSRSAVRISVADNAKSTAKTFGKEGVSYHWKLSSTVDIQGIDLHAYYNIYFGAESRLRGYVWTKAID